MSVRSSELTMRRLCLLAALPLFLLSSFGCSKGGSSSSDTQWIDRHEPHAKVALVFVHGLTGGAIETWTAPNGLTFFDLVSKDPLVAGQADTLAFGFPSYRISEGSFDIREAANRLHADLDYNGVLDYPAIVFVAHSMGGLVVLRELLTHREILSRVPLVVFFAVPQEGADIARIGKYIGDNPATAQMQPADSNALLQSLSDDWNTVPAEQRPKVRCAYENKDTFGVRIVPWSSATRYCEGSPEAIEANHIDIAKPDRPGHRSVVALVNALKAHVLGRHFEAILETPDFVEEGDHSVLLVTEASAARPARLVNAGGGKLRYTLAEFPDRGLYVSPGVGPDELGPDSTRLLNFNVGFGATSSEYRFVLKTSAAPDRVVLVRVPDLAAIVANYKLATDDAVTSLSQYLSDPETVAALVRTPAGDTDAASSVVNVVHEAVSHRMTGLSESARWLATAELLNAVNWPGLAVVALRGAETAEPSVASVPSAQRIAAESAALSGVERVFTNWTTPVLDPANVRLSSKGNPWVQGPALEKSTNIAMQLQSVRPLAVQGYSLEGDVERVKGDDRAAAAAYGQAAQIATTPSIDRRLKAAMRVMR